jgi:proteasome accessory factor B
MSQSRAERLMNLHIMLLGARHFVSKEQIRRAHYPEHPDTPAGDDAFERAFERDKDALRAIGAYIEVGNLDPLFDDDLGYRIPTEQTSLPQVQLEPDEAAVLGLATRVWQHATLAKAAEGALTKLKGLGIEVDPTRLEVLTPAISADEPGFDTLWEAVQRRRKVSFDYLRSGAATPTRRNLHPWGLVKSSGRWYVVGMDLDRKQERVFRLSRIVGDVKASGKHSAYDVPPGTDVRQVARRLVPSSPLVTAQVLVRRSHAVELRRRSSQTTEGVPGPDHGTWDRVEVTGQLAELSDAVLAHGPHAVVEAPVELRDDVVRRLRATVEAAR